MSVCFKGSLLTCRWLLREVLQTALISGLLFVVKKKPTSSPLLLFSSPNPIKCYVSIQHLGHLHYTGIKPALPDLTTRLQSVRNLVSGVKKKKRCRKKIMQKTKTDTVTNNFATENNIKVAV